MLVFLSVFYAFSRNVDDFCWSRTCYEIYSKLNSLLLWLLQYFLHENHFPQICDIIYLSSESSFNPQFMEKMDFAAFNDSNGVSFYNLSFTIKKDIARFAVCFEWYIKSNKQSNYYDARVSQLNLDVCKLNQGNPLSMWAASYVVNRINQRSNFRLQCPLKKGDYYVNNTRAPEEKDSIIASRFFSDHLYTQWLMTITTRFKLTDKSTAARGFRIKLWGATVRTS